MKALIGLAVVVIGARAVRRRIDEIERRRLARIIEEAW